MKIALRSMANGRLVCAENAGKQPLIANRDAVGEWETFEVVPLDAPAGVWWRGLSDFRLAQAQMAGEAIADRLAERWDLGASLIRVFGMKANNTGWDLLPQLRADYWGDLRRFFDTVSPTGLTVEWTCFADTRSVMPDQAHQLDFWGKTIETLRPYASFVRLELCNEWNHPTQQINPGVFPRPSGITASHGSGLTDADPVGPRWDYATYHARRDGAKGFTNYDPYEFQSLYPQPCPLIPDEGAKPTDYGFDTAYAGLMGAHARVGWGGTFHWGGGVNSESMDEPTKACARAFFAALA